MAEAGPSQLSVRRPGGGTARDPGGATARDLGFATARERAAAGWGVASKCVCTGQALHMAMVRQTSSFTIEAHDVEGKRRTVGGDAFMVAVRGGSLVRVRVADNGNGTYTCDYRASVSGNYGISISLYGVPLTGSPFPLRVLNKIPDPLRCKVYGTGMRRAVAREPSSFEIEFIDAFGQVTRAEELDCFVELIGDSEPPPKEEEEEEAPPEQPDLTAIPQQLEETEKFSLKKPTRKREPSPEPRTEEAVDVSAALTPPQQWGSAPPASKGSSGKQQQTPQTPPHTPPQTQQQRSDRSPPPPEQQPQQPKQPDPAPPATTTSSSDDRMTDDVRAIVEQLRVGLRMRGSVGQAGLASNFKLCDKDKSGKLDRKEVQSCLRMCKLRLPDDDLDRLLDFCDEDGDGVDINEFLDMVKEPVITVEKAVQPQEEEVDEGFHAPPPPAADGWMESLAQTPGGTNRGRTCPGGSGRSRSPYGRNPYGRTTARGRQLSPRRFRLDAAERQQHMTLWARRRGTDGVTGTKPPGVALTQRTARDNGFASAGRKGNAHGTTGPSYAHELLADPKGVAFAFGGVDPGTLHAGGRTVKVHTVHYSVGRAGKYRLHIGLRQQSAMLAGSPFELLVSPGPHHASWSFLNEEDLPLQGVVGAKKSKGVRVITGDRMANRCLVGQGDDAVKVWCPALDEKENPIVKTKVSDNSDGTYTINWSSDVSGVYTLHVSINGAEVHGSPVPLTLFSSKPQVSKFQVMGEGLREAIAGLPAIFRIESQDDFGNLCDLSKISSTLSFGVGLVSLEAGGKKSKGDKSKGDKAGGEGDKATKTEKSKEPKDSMPFEGLWVDGLYEIRYVAKEAGSCALHVWCKPQDGERERLPGGPFTLTVKEGQASADRCTMRGTAPLPPKKEGENQKNPVSSVPMDVFLDLLKEPLHAGDAVSVQTQLRDQYENAATASEGSLTATLEGPDGTHELVVKRSADEKRVGLYEISCTPELQGSYSMQILLDGQQLRDSPIDFTVTPGPPSGSKSHIVPPTTEFFISQQVDLVVQSVDKYGNTIVKGGATIQPRAQGNAVSACKVVDKQDGTYVISFTQNAAGDCRVTAKIMLGNDGGEMVPISIVVQPKDGEGKKKGKKDDDSVHGSDSPSKANEQGGPSFEPTDDTDTPLKASGSHSSLGRRRSSTPGLNSSQRASSSGGSLRAGSSFLASSSRGSQKSAGGSSHRDTPKAGSSMRSASGSMRSAGGSMRSAVTGTPQSSHRAGSAGGSTNSRSPTKKKATIRS